MTRKLQGTRPDYWPDLDGESRHFPGTVSVRAVGGMVLAQLAGAGYQVERQLHLSSSTTEEYFLLAHQRSGMGCLQQAGTTVMTAPGDMVLYSTARAYRLEFVGAFQQNVVRLAAAPLRGACPQIDAIAAVTLSGLQPQVALLGAMIEQYLDTDYARLPQQMALHASHALHHALATCALAMVFDGAARRSDLRRFHLDRIRQFVLARLGDSELAIPHVVQALGISASHLHRLFAGEGQTFGGWLWEMRLQACHTALRDPARARQAICQIAFQYGFSHAAHFSRAYRARYGMTPSAARKSRAAPTAPAAAVNVPAVPAGAR